MLGRKKELAVPGWRLCEHEEGVANEVRRTKQTEKKYPSVARLVDFLLERENNQRDTSGPLIDIANYHLY